MNSLCMTIQISIFIYYVYDFTLMILFYMRKAHFSIGWCVFSFGLGVFPLFSVYAFWLWEKQTVLVLYISVVHGVAAFFTPVQCVPLVL